MSTAIDSLVDKIGGDANYVRFLLAERPAILSALLAPAQKYNAEDKTLGYPTTVGSSLHNDIIELDQWMATLSKQDRYLLRNWALHSDIRPVFGRAQIRRVQKLIETRAETQ